MHKAIDEIVEKTRALPDIEKLTLVDELLAQLDRPDPEIDHIWAEEARKRWKAYCEGRIGTVPYAEVMAKYKRP
jgi:hypothetical protein